MHKPFVRSLVLLAVALPLPLWAATPSAGTLTDTSGPVTYSAGPFLVSNATPVPELDAGPECNNPIQPCDDYALTIALPAGYVTQHPNSAVRITASWTDTSTTKQS